MNPKRVDVMAGELARAAAEDPERPRPTTDPTAGETARAINEPRTPSALLIKDPTDPNYGRPS